MPISSSPKQNYTPYIPLNAFIVRYPTMEMKMSGYSKSGIESLDNTTGAFRSGIRLLCYENYVEATTIYTIVRRSAIA